MTDDKKKSEIEKQRKEIAIGSGAVLMAVFVGLAIILATLLSLGPIVTLANGDHLTDPATPYNELENATYTWTAQELADRADQAVVFTMLGAGIMLGGMFGLFAIPSKRRLHRIHCATYILGDAQKYCPKCGLKLSELEGKG